MPSPGRLLMAGRFWRRSERDASRQPAWLVAPGYDPSSDRGAYDPDDGEPSTVGELATAGAFTARRSVAGDGPDECRRDAGDAMAPQLAPTDGTRHGLVPGDPLSRADSPPWGRRCPENDTTAPLSPPDFTGRWFPPGPGPASRPPNGPQPGPVVPMHSGTRLDGEDGQQLWLPTPVSDRPRTARPRNGHLRSDAGGGERSPDDGRELLPLPVNGHRDRSPAALLERSLAAFEPVGEAEAAAFAARFAADYLSWDEDDPGRRVEVLRGYLTDPAAATLGWSGAGRQRADVVLPGRTLRTADGVLVVEVTARVTTYERDRLRPADAAPAASVRPPVSAVGPSCAPPPHGEGWRAGVAHWQRIAPPVSRDHTGQLVIDIGPAPDPDESS